LQIFKEQKIVLLPIHTFLKERQNVRSHIRTFSKSKSVQGANVKLPNPDKTKANCLSVKMENYA